MRNLGASLVKYCYYRNQMTGGCQEDLNKTFFIPGGSSSLFWTQTQ